MGGAVSVHVNGVDTEVRAGGKLPTGAFQLRRIDLSSNVPGGNPLISSCTAQITCKSQTNTFQINSPVTDGNGYPVGTGVFIRASPWTGQN